MALVRNKQVSRNYTVLETYEAGIVLSGAEVKSLRAGQAELAGAHIIVRGREAFIVGMSIPPYQPKNTPTDYEPDRTRKLLLSRKEIEALLTHGEQKGLTIVPISVYNKGRMIKLEVALVRGKKKVDKRETLKKREADRDIRRSLKRAY